MVNRGDFDTLNVYSEFLISWIDKNPSIRSLMDSCQFYEEVVEAIQGYCVKSNHIHSAHASSPVNYQGNFGGEKNIPDFFLVLEKRKDALRDHISSLEALREAADFEEDERASEASSQYSALNYKRHQPIQYL